MEPSPLNTKRTKPKAKAANTPAPDGHYTSGGLFESDDHAKCLGQLVAYWTGVEQRMIDFTGLLLGERSLLSHEIFAAVWSDSLRIKLMRALLKHGHANKGRGNEYMEVIDLFDRLRGKRNDYVHGVWSRHDSGRVFLSRRTDRFYFLTEHEVPITEIEDDIRAMTSLWGKINTLVIRDLRRSTA